MDDKPSSDRQEEEKPKEERKINENRENAGPSRPYGLPGAVQSPKTRPGLSKSEHNIRQIITPQDVTNALKSLSFGNPSQVMNNINLKDINIPILNKETGKVTESTTLFDLKQFMASCFKQNKDDPIANETPLQIHSTMNSVPAEVHEPNEICNTGTDCVTVPVATNEVIVTADHKVLKDKKKTSGNLSERSDMVAPRDSLSSIGSNVCRICMTRGRERLISPCHCKGSLANVHLSCLERWLNQVGRNHCELCRFSYPAIRTPRYTVLQALRLWFGNPRNRSHLQSDCLIFWLLSTVTAGLLAVCIVGTQYFVIEGNKFGKLDAGARKEEGISHRITETAMDFFMAIVLCGYSITVYLLWKDHYVMWNSWRRANVNVRLLLAPDTTPVPFAPRPRYSVV